MEKEIDLQKQIDLIKGMKELLGVYEEYDTEDVINILTTLESELEVYNMEVANG